MVIRTCIQKRLTGALRAVTVVIAIVSGAPFSFANPIFDPRNPDITLMQPIGSQKVLTPQPGIKLFFDYFNDVWPWVLGIAAGIGVLHAVMGGVDIMLSGNDSAKRTAGKEKILWALAGLIMIGLAGTILRTLNNTFYV